MQKSADKKTGRPDLVPSTRPHGDLREDAGIPAQVASLLDEERPDVVGGVALSRKELEARAAATHENVLDAWKKVYHEDAPADLQSSFSQ